MNPLGQRLIDDASPIASVWIGRLQAAGGSGFSHRPADELLPVCQAYIDALGRYLITRDDRMLREIAKREAIKRFQVGFPLDDLVGAYRGLQDLFWEGVEQEGTGGGPIEAGLWRLGGAIALSIEETVKAYQQQLTAQIAAHQRTVEALSRQLRHSASIDDPTGLFSAGVLHEYLPREIQRAQRYQRPVSVVVLDVDDFARLVDFYGTSEGDRALTELAQVIPGRVREVDIMCRLDQDEFAVILPEASVLAAVAVAERIRTAVEEHAPFAADVRASGPVRISAGVAGFPDDAPAAQDLVSRAREACQRAKRLGKNQVAAFSETRV